jgi:preprotein translocase subunit SecF
VKIKFLGLIFSFALATASLFSLSGCALKSSCDMKSGQSCHMDGKGKSCNCDKEAKKCSCDMKDGKCSCDMKSDKKGSCGAGKCGSESSMDKSKTK